MSKPSKVKIWLDSCRPKTLPASIAPVMIGAAMAYDIFRIDMLILALTFAAAILIQIGTNLANDYYDFIKGADTSKRQGPVRATQAGFVKPAQMKAAFLLAFALACVCGLYLVFKGGIVILLTGVISLALGVLYTAGPFPLAYYGLGDFFVLVFFGPVAVAGTYYLQTKTVDVAVMIAGLGPGLISTAILTVNNFRDKDTDRSAGKKTLTVRFGGRFSVIEYAAALIGACIIPVWLCLIKRSNWLCLLAVATIVPAGLLIKIICSKPDGQTLNNLLARTGKLLILYSVLFSIGWIA